MPRALGCFVASDQQGCRIGRPLLVELLLTFGLPTLALIGDFLALVGQPLAFVGDALTLVGESLARVANAVARVRAMMSFLELEPELLERGPLRC